MCPSSAVNNTRGLLIANKDWEIVLDSRRLKRLNCRGKTMCSLSEKEEATVAAAAKFEIYFWENVFQKR